MRISLCSLVIIIIVSNVHSTSLYGRGNQDEQNEYPNNVDIPSVLHKYEFDDPDVVLNPKESYHHSSDTNNDIDYEESQEGFRNYREYPDWFLRTDDENSEDVNVCRTESCHKAAKEMKNNIDPTVDPCDDFDKFACGGWRTRNPIPESHSTWTVFTKLWTDEEGILKKLIERQTDSPVNSSASLAYTWYASCMNQEEIQKSGSLPLDELIIELGSCPLLNPSWYRHALSWSFIEHLVVLNRLSIHPFFTVSPSNDLYNSSRVLLTVSPSKLLLRSIRFYLQAGDYYTAVRHAYIKLMFSLMVKLSHSNHINSVIFGRHIANIFLLEYYLAKARLHPKGKAYQKMTLRQLQWEVPDFPWKRYILKLYYKIPQKKPITGNEIVAVQHLYLLKKIFRILKRIPASVKANYLIWNVAYRFTGDLSSDYEAIHHEFIVAMYGKHKRKPRWRECVSSVSSALSMAVGKLFVEEKFNEDSKKKAEKIIEDIRQQLLKDFEEITWMDSSTAKNAEEKANAIVKNIGYPKFILNETLVREYYWGMSFHPREFIKNILKRRLVISANTLFSREMKPNRGRWSMSPQQINAYYSMNYNKIVFPAGILQSPFWHAKYPMYMQYAGLGFIVGHEITHGFDSHGMHYDKHGNFHGWWTNSSLKAFESKAQCLVDQYSHYKIFGKNINGNLTLGENIADNAGLRLAYKAYQKWLKENGTEKKLPGLPYNNDQLFFLKGAQIWCSNLRRTSTLNSIATDEHTPKIFRIIGPFSNCVEFSKAFKCPSDCRMNPKKKCSVW